MSMMNFNDIRKRDIILYKPGKFQKDVELFFDNLNIVSYLEDGYIGLPEYVNNKRVLDINSVSKDELAGKLVVICSFEFKEQEDRLKRLGLEYARDFIRGKDLIDSVDFIDPNPVIAASTNNKQIVVFGTGALAARFTRDCGDTDINIKYYVDNDKNKWGGELNGKPVIKPDDLLLEEKGSVFIVIASMHYNEIEAQLVKMGFIEGKEFVRALSNKAIKVSTSLEKAIRDTPITDWVCERPFNNFFVINSNGDVSLSCHSLIEIVAGNLFDNNVKEINNSFYAKLIRLSVINGTYSFCRPGACSYMYDNAASAHPLSMTMEEKYGRVFLGYDPSCNLHCPSCRNSEGQTVIETRIEKLHNDVINNIIPNTAELVVASNGDPFFSRYYREIIFDIFRGDTLCLQTNGLLFNKDNWLRLKGRNKKIYLCVSIDAATEETYKRVRGGDFNMLMENLRFAHELRKNNEISILNIYFVVQACNFREMEDFIEMGQKLGCDSVVFSRIYNWGHLSADEFDSMDVSYENNAYHNEYVEIMKLPIFRDKIVNKNQLLSGRDNK